MTTRAQQIRLGMFLVGFAVLLGGGLVFVAGSQFWTERDEYVIHFTESVAGLDVGSQVKVNGVSVGRVESVTLDRKNVENVIIRISLEGGVPIRRDAVAVIQMAGITGLKYIEVSPGAASQPQIRPGGTIRAGQSDLTMWTGRAEDISRQFQAVLARLLRVTSDENLEHVDGILAELHRAMTRVAVLVRNINDVLEENAPGVKRVVSNAGDAADSLAKTSDDVGAAVRLARDDLHGALNAGEKAARRIDVFAAETTKTAKSVGGIVDDARDSLTRDRIAAAMDALTSALEAMTRVAQSLQRTVDRSQTDLTATLEAIRAASEQLEQFSRTIRDNPGALLRSGGLPEEEVPR
jgi:phospholipid/cholesterol/gamma-HCH transport system substrate-binding protein